MHLDVSEPDSEKTQPNGNQEKVEQRVVTKHIIDSQVIKVVTGGYHTVNLKPFIHSLHIFHNDSLLNLLLYCMHQ